LRNRPRRHGRAPAQEALTVVPANAGTHNHKRQLLEEGLYALAITDGPRRMGHCVRRDDHEPHSTFSSAYTPHRRCCSIQPSKPLPITRHQPLAHFLTWATTPTCRRAAIALVGSGRS